MRLVIVWDLPVPGGPCSTKLSPRAASYIAASCEESALAGIAMSEGITRSSSSAGVMSSHSGCHSSCPDISEATTLFSASSPLLARRSFHMMKRLNENCPMKATSSTSQRGRAMTALRTVLNTRGISAPLSSAGSGSTPDMVMP